MLLNTLVVEVDFPTDRNYVESNQYTLDRIEEVTKTTLKTKTSMTISKLRVVPRDRE